MTTLDRKERVKVTEWLEVNRDGEGFSIKTGKQYKPEVMKGGYLRFNTRFKGVPARMSVHRAVALAFLPNPENRLTVNHKNAITDDNTVENLGWATYQEQQDHVKELGLRKPVFGEDTSNWKYSETLIRSICSDMEKGFRNNYIVDKYGVDVKLPSDLRTGRSWQHVTREYTIADKPRGTVPEDVVRTICDMLSKGFGVTKILVTLDLPKEILSRSKVTHIKMRNTYLHISDKYCW